MKYILTREVIGPIIVILVCFLLCILTKKLVRKMFNFKKLNVKDGKKKTIVNLINNIITVVLVLIAIIIIMEIYNIDTKSLIASFSVVGIVAGLAMQDILKDFVVGMFIIFEGQCSIGDWVCINNFTGEVIPSSLRTTKLRAYTGEVKVIYNRNITEIINYSMENANLIVDIDVTNDSDIEKVKKVLDKLSVSLKDKYNLKNLFCSGIHEIPRGAIRFRMVALSKYSDQFRLGSNLRNDIILEFKKNDIKMP